MRVIDVNTMKVTVLDVTCDDKKRTDIFPSNQSVEWLGKVYMLGRDHIHVITKDCKKHHCIENYG
jgi:hypothetical protein